MDMRKKILPIAVVVAAVALMGCSSRFLGGAAVGAVGAGGAYEYQNKKALNQLDDDFRSGRLSRQEYERRKDDIEKRSLIY